MAGEYTRVVIDFDKLEFYDKWLAVEEDLGEHVHEGGLVTNVGKRSTTVGRVLAVGTRVGENLQVGDLVLYEEWQGGRWNIGDVNCLIMNVDNVLARANRFFIMETAIEGFMEGMRVINAKTEGIGK